jgi:hypothetical protein
MREWKQLHGKGLWLAWALCAGVVFLIFSPLFVSAILQASFKGWLFLAACVVGGLIAFALFLGLLMPIVWGLLYSILFGLSRLLPKRVRAAFTGPTTRTITPLAALAIIGGFITVLVAFFAHRYDLEGVLTPLVMIAVVVGFFALVNWLDLKLQARRIRKVKEANHTPDSIRQPADGSPKPAI